MSKRFPIPDFDRDHYKNRAWTRPAMLAGTDLRHPGPDDTPGCHPVAAGAAFCERFSLRGEHMHLLKCVLPKQPVLLVGRSWAWYIQRALVVDSLEASTAKVLADWKTPRPMSTRLGPDAGITLPGGVVYAFCGHRYADHWIANRTLVDPEAPAGANGFSILSATDDDNDDFHACNLSFSWR